MCTEKQQASNWRNWALKTATGTATLMDKIAVHCPDAVLEVELCKEALKELELKIRAFQPPQSPPMRKARRIFVS